MLKPIYSNEFKKEMVRAIKRGKDINKLKKIIKIIYEEQELPIKHRNHKLKGEYAGYFECHIEPDWLLIYKKTKTVVAFARLGTHADLF